MTAPASHGAPAVVDFTTPTAEAGQPPVAVSCAPGPGASFPVGTNTVTCTATDALSRTASCSFSVVVTVVPTLAKVKFVAFGDSITAGQTSPSPTVLLLNESDSYPYKLQRLLAARYSDQTIQVVNEGVSGERADDTGKRRFGRVLDTDKPDVVLLLEGANDLNYAFTHTGDAKSGVRIVVRALQEMLDSADSRKVPVLLATLTPQDPEGRNGHGADALPELNADIRRLADDDRVIIVDLFNGLGGTPKGSIGADGLHPTADGYTKIAQIWFDTIQHHYEKPSSTGTARLFIER
jgi:lysophospholipase L1-like esterase